MLKRKKIGVRLADGSRGWKKAEGEKGKKGEEKEGGRDEVVDGAAERIYGKTETESGDILSERRLCTPVRGGGRGGGHKRLKKREAGERKMGSGRDGEKTAKD